MELTVTGDPVAVIGMACRLPGGIETPDQFWDALIGKRVGIADIPPERWAPYTSSGENAALLRGATSRGGFLAEPGAFDAAFFGITPREAELIDPQQRLVLETAWEALEDAGVPPHSLGGPAGPDTAVYMGVGSDDYGRQMLEDLPGIEAWSGIGAACCAVANRLSYFLNVSGPSFTVDAACASSLVAVHQGCVSLDRRESDLVLAGGVNVIAAPGLTVALDAAQALSPGGTSRPFDADADGYVRGEGVGVLVLKRLADATRDGDRVLAVIRGSAVRHGGRTSGIMAPSGAAQEAVARDALARAGIDAASIDYVEAHGTATRAGDPVEVAALGAVFGAGRSPAEPCLIGSVKGNIGHLEAAAGVAGIMKTILALGRATLPGQVGFARPNPAIAWDGSGLRVVADTIPWPATGHPRRAGVSSFGFGGTVCHVVVEQPPAPVPAGEPPAGTGRDAGRALAVYPLSAASEEALRDYADQLAELLDGDTPPQLTDLGYTLWRGRTYQSFRAALVARDVDTLRYGLGKLADDQPAAGLTVGQAPDGPPAAPVWVFSGHGSQWEGMGRELLETEPAFARAIDVIDPVFRAEIGWSPREKLRSGTLNGVDQIQAMIFVTQVGLAAVWRELGLRPAAIMGHSVGEVAAAVTAGVFDLADGARLICRRSLLLRRVAGAGAMVMVRLPFDQARELAAGHDAEAVIESSPEATVVAGTPEAIAGIREECRSREVPAHAITSDVAFHTVQMDPLTADLAAGLADLNPRPPVLPLYTTALADPRATDPRDGPYWAGNLRNPVRLATAVTAAAQDGHRLFLEISPHPVVAHSVGETLRHLDLEDFLVTGSLRRNQPERDTLLAALGALYCHGSLLDSAVIAPTGRICTLPRAPWQHRRFWRTPTDSAQHGPALPDPVSGTLLGTCVTTADPALPRFWRTRLDHDTRPYPGEHKVQGIEVVPAAILLNTLFAASGHNHLTGVSFHSPLLAADPREVQVIDHSGALRLASLEAAATDPTWQTHVTAVAAATDHELGRFDENRARAGCPGPLPAELPMERLRASGIAGAGLSWDTRRLFGGEGRLLAEVRIDDDGDSGWVKILDALTTIAPVAFAGEPVLRLLAEAGRVNCAGKPSASVLIEITQTAEDTVDAVLADESGQIVGIAEKLRFARLEDEPGTASESRTLLHRLDWRPVTPPEPRRRLRTLALVGGTDTLAAPIAARAHEAGITTVRVTGPDDLHSGSDQARVPANLNGQSGLDGLDGLDDRDIVLMLGQAGDSDAAGVGCGVGVGVGRGVDRGVGRRTAAAAWTLVRTAQLLTSPGRRASSPRLWCVTAGASSGQGLAQAPLWGVGQIISGEHPDIWGGIVDLDPADLAGSAGLLLTELQSGRPADILAISDGQARAARLVPLAGQVNDVALRAKPDGTYLITGGLGELGLRVAEWLASRGARRLLLAGRRPLPARSRWAAETDPWLRRGIDAIERLEGLGVTVRCLALDITDGAAVERALDPDLLGLPPVRGVVHAAGVLDNKLLADVDATSLADVLRPKVDGALVLDRLFPPGSLDFFVLFSSVGQYLGLPGQASYAAANAFLDQFAAYRRAGGHRDTTSLAWTSWSGLGMAVNKVVDEELLAHGIGKVGTDQAFQAWADASRHGDLGHICVFPVLSESGGVTVRPILSELGRASAQAGANGGEAAPGLADLPPGELRGLLTAEVAGLVSKEIRIPADDLDIRRPLSGLGLDSIMTLAIRRGLEKRFRVALPATLLWKHPTVSELAEYLLDLLTAEPGVS